MAESPRFVLDTNVIVSAALLKRSVPRQAVDRAIAVGRLLIAEQTISEINEVLRRPGFDKYVTEEERMQFLAALVHEADLIDVTQTCTECRDPKDNKFLELALDGQATAIVTGDPDLLSLHPFRGIPILTPRDFLGVAWNTQ